MTWRAYRDTVAHTPTLVGDLGVYQGLESPQLGNRRDILALLPPSYSAGGTRRYPVIYMHDGQNLFDAATSYAGEWQVDETMAALAREGLEAIIVGVPNAGEARRDEYSPFRDRKLGGGRGDLYLRFLIETVRPLIETSFRVDPSRRARGIMGSSMGGLISLYAFFKYPDAFGLAGVMSPALWFAGGRTARYVARRPPFLGRIYMDMGTAEYARGPADPQALDNLLTGSMPLASEVAAMLEQKGYTPGRDLLYILEEGAPHHESAWARRLPLALRFLLGA
ncbi:MAG: alpha/beta hydrolase [Chloroflexales bacterium]|nr:alpha/beta hydrolase [Chloroflexales bacterium]